MRLPRIHIALTMVLALYLGQGLAAHPQADSEQTIEYQQTSGSDWESIVGDRDYSERSTEDEAMTWSEPELGSGPDLSWLSMLKWPALIVLIALLLFLFIKLIPENFNTRLRKEKPGLITDLEEEEELAELDLEGMLREALSAKDYRMAVRIRYLMLLRDMEARSWISYKKDKTNAQYLHELAARKEFDAFASLTRAFEFAWYGGHEVAANDFDRLKSDFDQFTHLLSTDAGN